MNRLLVLPSLLALAGCQVFPDNDASFIIVDEKLADPGMSCAVSETTPHLSSGVLDVGLVALGVGVNGYELTPLVRNQLIVMTTAGSAGTQNNIDVQSVDVELSSTDKAVDAAIGRKKFNMPTCGCTIEPGTTTSFSVEVIPRSVAASVTDAVVAHAGADLPVITVRLRALGTRADSQVATGWTTFPVKLCNQCLLTNDPATPCASILATGVAKGGCNPVQDASLTCCTRNGQTVCGAGAGGM